MKATRPRTLRNLLAASLALAVLGLLPLPVRPGGPDSANAAATGATTRVSVGSAGTQANGMSSSPSISADGRYVAFQSEAASLVPGDTNGVDDVFVHDRVLATTTRVSVDASGVQGNGASQRPWVSADGRYVAFDSTASNLVSGDTNVVGDVFVVDRSTGLIAKASVDSLGVQGNGNSFRPSLSADGRYVTFTSPATNLVPADTNGRYDVFVHDRQTGTTSRESVSSSGLQSSDGSTDFSVISESGLYVAFSSSATNLVSGDTNGLRDVFVRDRALGTTTRVSVSASGAQGVNYSSYPSLSADGRYAAFVSKAPLASGENDTYEDIFVRDREAGTTERVSPTRARDRPSPTAPAPTIPRSPPTALTWPSCPTPPTWCPRI